MKVVDLIDKLLELPPHYEVFSVSGDSVVPVNTVMRLLASPDGGKARVFCVLDRRDWDEIVDSELKMNE